MACSKYASTKQTTNAACVSRLLLDPCTDMLGDVLRHYLSETSFPGKLQRDTLVIKPLLNATQRAMLYPQRGTFTGNYQVFDISLLYLLLRNISGIIQHAKGWGKTPSPGDRSISANIERIRNIRNTYIGHINQSSMSDSQFNSVWQEVRHIATELVKDVGLTTDYVGLIDRLEHEPMDPELEQAYLQKLDDTELTVAEVKVEQDKQIEIQRNQGEIQTKHGATLIEHEVRLDKQGEVQTKHGTTLIEHEDRLNKQGEVQTKHCFTLTEHQDRLAMQDEIQSKHGANLTEHDDHLNKQDKVQTKNEATLTEHEERLDKQSEVQTTQRCILRQHEDRLTEQGAILKEHEKRFIKQEVALDEEAMNILGNTKAVLQNHRSSRTYIRTKQIDTVVRKLKEHHIVILTGKPGDGKSTIGKQVLFELSEASEYVPAIITKPKQWAKVVNPYKKMIVYIDDIFGSTNFDISAVEKWKKMFDLMISSAHEGKTCVLISSRSTIISEVRKSCNERFLSPEYENDLTSNVLTSIEKRGMLHQYGKVHIYRTSELIGDGFRKYEIEHGKDAVYKLSEWERDVIAESEPYYGFPQTCFLFFARKEFFQLGTNFFLRPNQLLFENIDNMRKSTEVRTKMRYCTLVYVFLEGSVHLRDLKDDIFQEICEKSSLTKLTEVDVEDSVKDLEGIYLSASNQTHVFRFSHVTIREAVATSFGKLAPDIVIQKCSLKIIRELIRTEGYEKRDGEVLLSIRKKYYPLLANRLLSVSTRCIVRHPASDDEDFTSVLFDVISKSPHNSLTTVKEIWDKIKYEDKLVLYREILARHGPHCIKHETEYDRDMSVVEHDRDTSVERPYLITCEEVKNRLNEYLQCGGKEGVIIIIRYVISKCDVIYFLNSYDHFLGKIRGMSVLHCCVARGWTDVVDELLNVVTTNKTKNNWSCLHFAAFFGRFELFKKFEKLSSFVLETTREGYNILQVVLLGLRYGLCKLYSELVLPFYYLSVFDSNDDFVCFWDISLHETDFISILQHVMTEYPSLINSIDMSLDSYNNNIIHYLVIHDRQKIYDMLVRKKKDLIFHRNDTELPTTLHVAVYLGRVKFVEKLWKAGVRAEVTDLSIAKSIESGKKYSNNTLKGDFKLKSIISRYFISCGKTEDYTAISSICSAVN